MLTVIDPRHGRKREREDDFTGTPQGFAQHRVKRQATSLPWRLSGLAQPSFYPSISTRTPARADADDSPTTLVHAQAASTTWPASPATPMVILSSEPSTVDHAASDTHIDEMHLAPSEPNHTDRIPTPIHSQFPRAKRGFRMPSQLNLSAQPPHDVRRLPSPIGEADSPSVILHGLQSMQVDVPMEVDAIDMSVPPTTKTPTNLKHRGSQEALTRKSFSIGYRADCEKCIRKVPGHFSHIISR